MRKEIIENIINNEKASVDLIIKENPAFAKKEVIDVLEDLVVRGALSGNYGGSKKIAWNYAVIEYSLLV